MRDSMVFYRSFYEAIKELPLDVQAKVYSAIFEYSLNFNEVVLEGLPKTIFTLIKPQLDANNKRFENGKKGGRKKVDNNQTETKTETKTEPKQNQTETKTEPNNNVNVNDNVNDNVNEREKEISLPPEIKKKIENSSEKVINETFSIISKDDRWIEVIAINNHLRPKQKVIEYLNAFYKKLENEGTVMKSVNDAKSHFARWLNIELNKQ